LSERKACQVVELQRTTFRRPLASQKPTDPDAGLRSWLCTHAAKHPRWGYRRAHHDARDYGWCVNHKKTQRLWREEGLRVPIRRRLKGRGASTSSAPTAALYPHHVWAIHFQAGHLEDGTGFKVASIIDEHTRLVLDDTVDVSITEEDVVDILARLALTHGMPKVLHMDNGPEFTCRALAQWVAGVVHLAFIPPGEPWKSGYVESFHLRQGEEFLNISTFATTLHARVELTGLAPRLQPHTTALQPRLQDPHRVR